MSFEPKIFNSDEPAGRPASPGRKLLGEPAMPLWNDVDELGLRDDLAALAEQLRDDAVFLAQAHPADATPEQRAAAWLDVQRSASPRSRFARLRWWLTGAAAAAVVLSASWIGWRWNERESPQRNNVAVATSPKSVRVVETPKVEVAAARLEEADAPRSPGGPRIERLPDDSPPRVMPAGFLQDVSGPELDAMIELLSEQSDAGLSI